MKDPWGTATATDLASRFTNKGGGWELVSQSFTDGDRTEIRAALTQLKQSRIKVFVVMAFEIDSMTIAEEATSLGLIGADYVWTYGDINLSQYWSSNNITNVDGFKGSLAFFSEAQNSGTSWSSFEGLLPNGFTYPFRHPLSTRTLNSHPGTLTHSPDRRIPSLVTPLTDLVAGGWALNEQYRTQFNSVMPTESWGQLSQDFFTAVPSSFTDVGGFSYDAVASIGLAACNAANASNAASLIATLVSLDYQGELCLCLYISHQIIFISTYLEIFFDCALFYVLFLCALTMCSDCAFWVGPGVSGNVKFDAWGTRVASTGNFVLKGLQPGAVSFKTVGAFDSSDFTLDANCAACDGSGAIFYDGTTNPPSAKWPSSEDDNTLLIVIGCCAGGLLLIGVGLFFGYRHWRVTKSAAQKGTISSMKAELKQFKDSLINVVVIKNSYMPVFGAVDGAHCEVSIEDKDELKHISMSELDIFSSPNQGTNWYWEEDANRINQHNPADVLAPNWVRYPLAAEACIESQFQGWKTNSTSGKVHITLHVVYDVDFNKMVQTKRETGYERRMQRHTIQHVLGVSPTSSPNSTPIHIPPSSQQIPQELHKENHAVLLEGTLVQISKHRKDGWVYGSVVYCPNESFKSESTDDRISIEAGWFPEAITSQPTSEQIKQLAERMGGAAVLAPPKNWVPMKDPDAAQLFNVSSSNLEYQQVASAFLASLGSGEKVTKIERVQNLGFWQTFSVKRQTMLMRESEKDSCDNSANVGRLERKWLFHGTNSEVLPKIIQQGFNRSFCGKNATVYRKVSCELA